MYPPSASAGPSAPPVPARRGLRALPGPLAEAQARIEQLYHSRLSLEAELAEWRALTPPLCRCARPGPLLRLARRLPGLRLLLDLRLLTRCGLFDAPWYLRRYPDVPGWPAWHYLRHGAAERRDPGPWFSSGHYLDLYPDIAAAGCNPLVHYLLAGRSEGRSARPGMPEALAPQPSSRFSGKGGRWR